MSTITVGSNLLVHSGGTKFYEIIGYANPPAMRYIEVRRWGPVAQMKTGGGQISVIEHPSNAHMTFNMEKQFRAKEKGGYQSDRSTRYGYIQSGRGSTWGSDEFRNVRHYSGIATRESIFAKLALDATPAEPTVKPVTEPVFEPSVDRGEAWGSW